MIFKFLKLAASSSPFINVYLQIAVAKNISNVLQPHKYRTARFNVADSILGY